MRDVGMIELSEDLTLDFEPRLVIAGNRPAVDHLDGHLLFELGIRPLGKENLPHAADTQGAQYAILSYAVAHHGASMHREAGAGKRWAPCGEVPHACMKATHCRENQERDSHAKWTRPQ
jgi:hypothetical protein